jgi:hypothetical protein
MTRMITTMRPTIPPTPPRMPLPPFQLSRYTVLYPLSAIRNKYLKHTKKKGRRPEGRRPEEPLARDFLHHAAHAAHTAGHTRGGLVLGLGHHHVGGDDEAADGRRVLQCRAGNHRRVYHTCSDEILVLTG